MGRHEVQNYMSRLELALEDRGSREIIAEMERLNRVTTERNRAIVDEMLRVARGAMRVTLGRMAPHNPRYLIIGAQSRILLQMAVDPKLTDGVWECSGPPFWDAQTREWCQAIVRRLREPAAGTVNLREVKRR